MTPLAGGTSDAVKEEQPGRFADLAVLSQDIFAVPPTELPMTGSLLTMVDGTMVDGTIVYDTGVLTGE